jgi:hypothetical protein
MKHRVCLRVALTALLVTGWSACRQSEEAKQLAALDHAYQAGVITKAEYDRKTAALRAASAALSALDRARDAGVVTPQEYQAKRAQLLAQSPAQAQQTATAAVPPASASSGAPSPTVGANMPAAPLDGLRQESIFDPTLRMNAYTVTLPSHWKSDAAYVAGSSCAPIPFPVFRIYSPDGLSEVRGLPRLDWSWSTSKFKPPQQADCLDLKQELSGQDFLKYLTAMMDVTYVREDAIPQQMNDALQKQFAQSNEALANSAKQMEKMNGALHNQGKVEPAEQHGGWAAAIAEYRNGSFLIEEQLRSLLRCTHSPINYGPERGAFTDSCTATVRIVRAPKGQLAALLAEADAKNWGAVENPDWVSKYLEAMRQDAQARSREMFQRSQAQMQQRHADFERAQSVRQQQHEQFLATMQQGTDRAMARARDNMNQRSAVASDWADYVLDRQTVTGPGGTVKISNAYSHTWTDGSGAYYQTSDPNANPNGVLPGNWTATTQVHGNGTAK